MATMPHVRQLLGVTCVLLMVLACSHVEAALFSYGSGQSTLHRNDDGYSSAISISTSFPYFGRVQSRLYVCTNGIISFGSGVSSFTPRPFPIANNPVVAPFWGDVDIRTSGTIYYGQASGGQLSQMTSAIGINGFSATWGYVVTWYQVPAYPGRGSAKNTFQAALCTDGTSSFVIFNYQQISWLSGSASGGTAAQMGFDAGDRSNSYAHEWSRTNSMSSLPRSSNVGYNGRYIFGVGAPVVVPIDEVVVDPCEGVTCSGRGTCNDGTCSCNTGYEGNNCQTVINWCSRQGINCNNRGTCSNTADNRGWQCSCRHSGYYGSQCETIRNWCSHHSITCQHGGTCTNSADNVGWQCNCVHSGYYGDYCQTIRDWCTQESEDCTGHGTCVNNNDNSFLQCNCRHSGYYGFYCENIVDWCTTESEDCNGHGACSNRADNDFWQCTCDPGYRSTDCAEQLCLGGQYCYNLGVCGPFGCQCVSPWSGDTCQVNNPSCTGVDCGHGSCSGSGNCDCHSGYGQLSRSSPCEGQVCGGQTCHNGGSCVDGACVCAIGWLGDTCESYDLCDGAECSGHGQCVVFSGAAVCRCDDSSFGPESGDLSQQCSRQTCSGGSTCQNGGVCNSNGGCDCPYPYTGATCGSVDYCTGIDCVHGSCSTQGTSYVCTCSSSSVWVDPLTGLCTTTVCPNGYTFCRNTGTCQSGSTCSCPNGYSGDNCETWNACYGVTCYNDGVCRDNQHNGGDYLCDCADGFHGRHCELQRCVNGYTCYNGGRCSDAGCDCPIAWTGVDCLESVPTVCQNHYCGAGGTCSGSTSPVCTCASGYIQEGASSPCNLACADLNCQNGGICNADYPFCQCQEGYFGTTCESSDSCAEIECHYARGSCGAYQGASASCQCILPSYTGSDCSTEVCSSGPQPQCLNGGSCMGSGCECVYPYEGSRCETLNYCPSGYCVHGTCTSTAGGAACTCDEGYIKDLFTGRCTTQYLCSDGYTFCMNGGACSGSGTSCTCATYYSGTNCEIRDLCLGVSCTGHGHCTGVPELVSHRCTCDEGWVGDDCQYQRCHNDVVCHNGAFCSIDGCVCLPGWTGADCSEPLPRDCFTNQGNMDCGHGVCVSGGSCSCDRDWATDGSGLCVVQVCGSVSCRNGATCVAGRCDCPPGYYGQDCSDAECQDIDCGSNGRCHMMNDATNVCVCDDLRWYGVYCENERCTDSSVCQNGGSCVSGGGCTCLPGYTGANCETSSPCTGVTCSQGTCHVINGRHYCRCATGYIEDPDTGLCTIQLCSGGSHMCMNGQSCNGAASCACTGAYSGDNCQIVDYCYENTCNGHGSCRIAVDFGGNSLHRHECVCEDGFHGSDCQYQFCTDFNVCFNGGTCRPTGCECTPEWQGVSCEVVVPEACSAACGHGECDSSGTCECYPGYAVGTTGICDANTPISGVCSGTTCYNGGTCITVANLLTGYDEPQCTCTIGWTGIDCRVVDECENYDCSGHGQCVMYQGTTPRCYCDHERYSDSTGGTTNCDRETCTDSSYCYNGGSCIDGGESCACPYPYEGPRCETRNVCPGGQCAHGTCSSGRGDFLFDCECDEGYIYNELTGYCNTELCADHSTFCQNGGTCVNGADTSTCSCPAGITGTNCEEVDMCHGVECNNGWCKDLTTHSVCECLEGYTGRDCSLQRCVDDATCFNGGTCGFEGCRCTDQWEGPTCEIPRETLCQGVNCEQGSCVSDGRTYQCVCDTGFENLQPTDPCVIDVCDDMTCQNGGTCLPPSGNDPERCSCMPGYVGTNCEIVTCEHVDCHAHGRCVVLPNGGGQCVCDDPRYAHYEGPSATPGDCSVEVGREGVCFNGGSCSDTCQSCTCPWPYVGTACEMYSPCDMSLDTCVHGTCYAEARDGRDFWCYCDEGYLVDDDSGLCVTEVCDAHFCLHGSTCNEDELSCACPPGTTGDHCEIVDHCYGRDCTGHGTCRVIEGLSYSCACTDGWVGVDCELQRCTANITCFNGGSCTTDFGCQCAPGFGGPSCEEVYYTECQALSCVHGLCDDSSRTATCLCDRSWSGSDCNSHDCQDGGTSCQNGGTCVDGNNIPWSLFPNDTCHCVPPYGGPDCSILNPCAGRDCSRHGRCIEYDGSAQCVCDDARWSGDECDMETCSTDSRTCLNGGSCVGDSCACPHPYYGDNCENIDPCRGNPCINGFCAVSGSSYDCDCYDTFTHGITGVCDTQWCTDGSRFCMNGGTCTDHETYSTCQCPAGVTGVNCETVDHCASQGCNDHGLCENRVDGGGYTCHCFDDWLGQDCSMQRCLDLTCLHNGVCGTDGCRCPPEWTGDSCEIPVDPNCYSVECGPHGTCYVEEPACESGSALSGSVTTTSGTSTLNWVATGNELQMLTLAFDEPKIVTSMTTSGESDRFVTTFQLEYFINDSSAEPVRSIIDSSWALFGNEASRTSHIFDPPLIATHIVLHPRTYHSGISINVEFSGCSYPQNGMCDCEEGYSSSGGEQACDVRDECLETGPCQNGGTCVNGDCLCEPGFNGHNCEISVCNGMDCHGHGRCVVQEDGIPTCVCDHDRWTSIYGDCSVEYCAYPLLSPYCLNGGRCVPDNYLRTEFHCECPYPYYGIDCGEEAECSENPCVHGTCYISAVENTDSHCVCHAPYIRDPDSGYCTTEQCADGHAFCMNGGSCSADGNGCECPAGVSGDNCDDVDYCHDNDCTGHGVCYEIRDGNDHHTATSHYCECEWGWVGVNCELQMCTNGNTCFNGGSCTTFGCECAAGYGGSSCEYVYSNVCRNLQCVHGYCDDVNYRTATCVCDEGYDGSDCNTNVCDGESRSCQNGGSCVDDYGSASTHLFTESRCYCPPPYGGDDCSEVDPCANRECSLHGHCREYEGEAQCVCDDARWSGDNCENEVCRDESICRNGGSCTSDSTCECPFPYYGTRCELTNYCMDDHCTHGSCTVTSEDCASSDSVSGATSGLAQGDDVAQLDLGSPYVVTGLEVAISGEGTSFTVSYSMDAVAWVFVRTTRYQKTVYTASSRLTTIDVEPFTAQYIRLHRDNAAVNTFNAVGCTAVQTGFECDCNEGFYPGITGVCDTELCTDGSTFCMNGATCESMMFMSYFFCACTPGRTGENCETVDECYNQDCNQHGRCENRVGGGGHTCHCFEGWYGQDCSINNCLDDHASCMNGGICGALGCRCTEQWTGDTCEERVDADCQGIECGHGTCVDSNPDVCADQVSLITETTVMQLINAVPELSEAYARRRRSLVTFLAPFAGSYVEITLDQESLIEILLMQGDTEIVGDARVKTYQISYRRAQANDWHYVRSSTDSSYKTFIGNLESSDQIRQVLDPPILAQHVRIHPVTFDTVPYMTIDFLGCGFNQSGICECDEGYSRSGGVQDQCHVLDGCVETGQCANGGTCRDGNCLCRPGFFGHNCELSACYDANVNCHDHGRCVIRSDGSPACVCSHNRYGHSSNALSTDATDCSVETCNNDLRCHNGGSCVPTTYLLDEAVCACVYPWTGPTCQTNLICNINPCVHGICTVVPVFNTDSHCVCDEGYILDPDTQLCTTELCADGNAFCMHGSVCNEAGDGCDCPAGITGDNCENIDYCHDNECSGHGVCYEVPAGDTYHTATHYICECEWGWVGEDCELQMCTNNITCFNGGTCTTHGCTCAEGYGGNSCEYVYTDACTSFVQETGWLTQDWPVHGFCDDTSGEPVATCFDRSYTGTDCNIHVCDGGSRRCENGGTCVEASGNVTHGEFPESRCFCLPPWGGDDCNYEDPCARRDCNLHGECREYQGDAICVCDDTRWSGDNCENEECLDGSTCQNGGSCDSSSNCLCPYPFHGERCELTNYCIDNHAGNGECHVTSETCSTSRANLVQTNGGLFSGLDNGSPFAQANLDQPYVIEAIQISWSGDNSFTVSYSMDGNDWGFVRSERYLKTVFDGFATFAEAFTAQYVRVHMNSATSITFDLEGCVAVQTGFESICDENYIVGVDGTCSTQLCADGFTFCLNGGYCHDDATTSFCYCPPGMTGTNCETVDHCYNQDCSGHGRCENRVDGAGYTCHCNLGYLGQDCALQRCLATDNTCMNGGVCGPEGCRCTAEWAGDSCEVPVHVDCQYVHCGVGQCTVPEEGGAGGVQGCASSASLMSGASYSASVNSELAAAATLLVPGAWQAGEASDGHWIQATFAAPKVISSVATQGFSLGNEWVTAYHVSYSMNNVNFTYIRSFADSRYKTFMGNSDAQSVVENQLEHHVVARYVRLHPQRWEGGVSLRFGLQGCNWAQTGVCDCPMPYVTDEGGSCTVEVCSEESFTCANGGTCYEAYDGELACNCRPGYSGRDCSVSSCANINCNDHGRCVVLSDGTAICVCDHERWTHDETDGVYGYCALEECGNGLTCQHGGSCLPRPTGETTVCVCPYPWAGDECETYALCSSNPCVHGDCHDRFVYGTESHCLCDEPYTLDPDTQLCTTEQCADGSTFCMNGGSCNVAGNACMCPNGVSGDNCQDIDYCFGRYNCSGHGRCVEVETGSTYNTATDYACLCDNGWQGRECDQQRCNDDVTCMNGGWCRFDGCVCPSGWGGLSCEIPLDEECYTPQDYNCSHGYCVFRDNQFGCECYENYAVSAADRVTCDTHTVDGLSCYNGGTVGVDDDGEPRCHCTEDFTGLICATRSPCADFDCSNNGRCILDENEVPGCACHHERWTGARCEIVTCNDHETICYNGGSCLLSEDASYTCTCPYPYFGADCTDVDYCSDVEQTCGHAIRCHDGIIRPCNDNRMIHHIQDSQISATGSMNRGLGPEHSRLDSAGAWVAGSQGDLIKIDLGSKMAVSGIVTRGYEDGWITSYQVRLSENGVYWSNPITMDGNHDGETSVTRELELVVLARYVELQPLAFNTAPALRWDILACPYEDFTCECDFDVNAVTGHVRDDVTGMCSTATCSDGETFCLNGGECVDRENGTSWCHCPESTTGEHCETVDYCFRVDCSLNGLCENRPHHADHVCLCNEGWMGHDCSMQRCTEGITCMNAGVCGPEGCRCTPEWQGVSCEEPVPLRCQGATSTENGVCVPDEVDYTVTTTGCECWFDPRRTDCACCEVGGCVCSEEQPFRCAACGDTDACDTSLEQDIVEHRTWQSTTEGASGNSDHAVDGDITTETCTLTLHGTTINTHHNDWWTVDLGAAKRIYAVRVFNSDTNSDRLRSISVLALADHWNPVSAREQTLCTHVADPVSYSEEGTQILCDSPVVGRYLSIQHMNNTDALTLCEVQVIADDPYTILCDHGYTNQDGDRFAACDVQICDYATNRTCEHGGVCLSNNTCGCAIGYSGENCEHGGCAGVDCYDHGRCETLWDGSPQCVCHDRRWTHDDDLDVNEPGVGNCALETCPGGLVCHNGGSCVADGEGYACSCTYHWVGRTCEEPAPCPDETASCLNALGCHNGEGIAFTCECENDFIVHPDTGVCSTQVCDDGFGGRHLCMHQGSCVMNEDGSQGCSCPPGIYGDNCEYIDRCHEVTCSGHGLCRNDTESYYCQCDDGWIGTDCNMQRCDDYFTCFNGARCQADGWNQGCICPESYTGISCEIIDYCLDVDCGSGRCVPISEQDEETAGLGFNYVCDCQEGWLQSARNAICDNEIIPCALPPWVEEGGSVQPFCQYGGRCAVESIFYEYEPFYLNYTADPDYEGDLEGVWIQPENRTVGNISCDCHTSRIGDQCEIYNECYVETCSGHGLCEPSITGRAMCTCDPGYEGETCNVHMCSSSEQRCHNGGTCSQNNECTCVYPYTGDTCEETDFCTFAPGWEMNCYNGHCTSREDGFLCVCDDGYIRNQDTGECSTELCNEAEDTFCMNYGSCNDEYSNCTCHEEWIDHNCETYNWCWNQTCSLRGDCINFEFDYNCSCFPGFYGRDCDLQVCYDDVVCRNNSLCSTTGCICTPGYTGVECDIADPCFEVDCGPGGRCVENMTLENPRFEPIYYTADYYCEWIGGRQGRHWTRGSEEDHTPFDVRICDAEAGVYCYNQGVCARNEERQYVCNCVDGFFGEDCSVPDACNDNTCSGHGSCHINADFTSNCTCEENYMEADCSVHFCPASEMLCMNGGTCPHEEFSDQTCWCPFPYTGRTCEEIDFCVDVDCAQGTCNPRNGTCECNEGWIRDYHTGKCTTSVCNRSNMFCMNNGTCTEGEYSCQCHDWFNYNEWNADVDVHCEHWNYCFNETCNGRGMCINHPDGFTCDCDPGFVGEMCTDQPCVDNIVCQNFALCSASGCVCDGDWTGPDCSEYVGRCHGIDCGAGECVVMPTLEEGCGDALNSSYMLSHADEGNWILSASSYSRRNAASAATLDQIGWVASRGDTDPWIQVTFDDDLIVHGWLTQGFSSFWVTRYNMSYSSDGSNWHFPRDDRDILHGYKTFEGNTDGSGVVEHYFPEPLILRSMRLHIVDYNGAPGLKFDLLGCRYQPAGYECNCDDVSLPGIWHHEVAGNLTSSCNVNLCDVSFSNDEPATCFNLGQCLYEDSQVDEGLLCTCTTGWTGPLCDIRDECLSAEEAGVMPSYYQVCYGRGANCTVDVAWNAATGTSTPGFNCDCEQGRENVTYTGAQCDVALCGLESPLQCNNGGSCSYDLSTCECAHPYTGENCDTLDYCANIDCMQGTCVELEDGFECICQNEWIVNLDTGLCTTHICENRNHFCMNEGHCSADIGRRSRNGDCTCNNFDFADNCELPNQCGRNRACNNRGVCNRREGECTCRGDEYEGAACETEVCNNGGACLNGGSCVGDGASCACVYPYEGERCEIQNWCEGVSCFRGECNSHEQGYWLLPWENERGGFNCTCEEGYTHDTTDVTARHKNNCTTQICEDGSLCHNMGVCVQNSGGAWTCDCASGYDASDCSEEESNAGNSDAQTGMLGALGGGLGGGTAGVGAGAASLMALLRRRRKQQPEAHEADDCDVEDMEEYDAMPNSTAPSATVAAF